MKAQEHDFVCITPDVRLGHDVVFINDSYPSATTKDCELPNRRRLESGADRRQQRRLDRFWRDDSCQCHHSLGACREQKGDLTES